MTPGDRAPSVELPDSTERTSDGSPENKTVRTSANHRAHAHFPHDTRPRLSPLQRRQRRGLRALRGTRWPAEAPLLPLRDRERQLSRRLRHARGSGEPEQGALSADRAPGDSDPRALCEPGRSDLPPRRRPWAHEHGVQQGEQVREPGDRKSTRLSSSHVSISYAVFCLKKKKQNNYIPSFKKKKKIKTYINYHTF